MAEFTEKQYCDLRNSTNQTYKASSKNEHWYLPRKTAKNLSIVSTLLKGG